MPDGDASETEESESTGDPETERARKDRHIDEQEEESFPASDPHADWSGPAN